MPDFILKKLSNGWLQKLTNLEVVVPERAQVQKIKITFLTISLSGNLKIFRMTLRLGLAVELQTTNESETQDYEQGYELYLVT